MKQLSKREIESYCGDQAQLFHIRACTLEEGKSKNMKAYQVDNGMGLEFLVLPDKSFAIPQLKFQGVNVGFICKAGISAPEFYQEEGTRGFLRNFEAGFLTTCGLTYMGTPGVEDGQANGLHGIISNTPAEHTYSRIEWEDDEAFITFGGESREAHLFGPNMVIDRQFKISTTENKILIHDVVTNKAFEDSPLMLLYHFNMGYPMLDGCSKTYSNMEQIGSRDGLSQEVCDNIDNFQEPTVGFEEEVFFRTTKEDTDKGYVVLHNPELEKAVVIKFDPKHLPILNQWKSPRAGDYALGLEPGTAHVGGRIRAKEEGILRYLGAGQSEVFDLEIEFIDCKTENEKLLAFIK